MTSITKKNLPHGTIPFSFVKDGNVRKVLMQMNENIGELKRQLATAQTAIIELQGKA